MRFAFYTKMWQSNGTGLFMAALAQGMLGIGHDVTYVCPETESPAFEAGLPGLMRIRPPRQRDGASRPMRIAASLARIAGSLLGLLRARAQTRWLVVSIPDPLLIAIPMLALLRLTGARIIYIVHDPLPHAWYLSPRWHWLENLGFVAIYRLSSALVVLSEAGATTLRAHYRLGRRPVAVAPHGPLAVAAVPPLADNRRLLVFGTLRRNKGIAEAIHGVLAARAAGADVTLHIAGAPDPIDPAYWAELAPLAAVHAPAITVTDRYIADDELAALIARSDALLLPYQAFHSQSGVALLAATNRRPLIASRSGGLGELLDAGLPGVSIADPVDAAAVAAAIAGFRAVPAAEWRAACDAHADHFATTHSWERAAQIIAALAA